MQNLMGNNRGRRSRFISAWLGFDKEVKIFSEWRRVVFNKCCWKNWMFICKGTKLDFYFILYEK